MAVFLGVDTWKEALPCIGLPALPRIIAVTPGVFRALDAAPSGKFPFRLRRQARPRPASEGVGLGEALRVHTGASAREAAARGGAMIGFVLLRTAADEAEILTIGVRPDWQGHGIGARLMAHVLAHAHRERLASVGRPFGCVDVKVTGEGDRPLPAGETGEILCRGDTVMAGYWNNAEASRATLRGGYLHTGDVGAFDTHGYLTLKDRSKDLIISGGSNIYPREVEEVLLRHTGVREVSVIGRPDREWGEVVVAYVVGEVPAAELDALCLSAIARFKRPKDYVFVEALPKNNYGKVLKTELRTLDTRRAPRAAG